MSFRKRMFSNMEEKNDHGDVAFVNYLSYERFDYNG